MTTSKHEQASEDEAASVKIDEELSQELDRLKAELTAKTDEAKEYLDHLQRLQAEFENYRKRMMRDQTKMVESAAKSLIEALLPILDNFELALRSIESVESVEKYIDGISLVYADFIDILHKQGLEKIPAEGAEFDPQIHEAVMCEDVADEASDNLISEVMRDGYRLAGQVIRPAMVKVLKYKAH